MNSPDSQLPATGPLLPAYEPSSPGPVDNVPYLPLAIPGQAEFDLAPPPPPPPLQKLSPKEQLAELDKRLVGRKLTDFARRNRLILALKAKGQTIAAIHADTLLPVPTIKWALEMGNKRAFERLVEKHRVGRKGRRQEILAALRQGIPPSEVQRQFGSHRETIRRALQQLKTLNHAA